MAVANKPVLAAPVDETQTETEVIAEPKTTRKAPVMAADAGLERKPSTPSGQVVVFFDPTLVQGLNVTDLSVQLPTEVMGMDHSGVERTVTMFERSTVYPGLQPMTADQWDKWQQSQAPLATVALADPAAISVTMYDPADFTEYNTAEQIRLVRQCSSKAAVPLINQWSSLAVNEAVKKEIAAQSAKLNAPNPYAGLAGFAAQ